MPLKPSFFIVGVPKAGTTALHDYLSRHPQVAMSEDKEPNYFSWKEIEEQQLYYRKKNVKSEEEYLHLFNTNPNAIIAGEASISYLFYHESANRIKAFQPNAKIIISLREPVARAVSHYQMDYSLGLVREDLETIWKQGRAHKNTGIFFQQYFQLSEYYPQIENYLKVFSKDQLLIFLHNSLKEDPQNCLKRLCSFLHIDLALSRSEITDQNVTVAGKNKIIRQLYSNDRFRKGLSYIFGDRLKNNIKNALFSRAKLPEISDTFKSELKAYYKPGLIKLEGLTGLQLEKWYK